MVVARATMGCCGSKKTDDNTWGPSPFALMVATDAKTDYKPAPVDVTHTAQAKILVVCTDNGKFEMANGKVFDSGNHPTETLLPLLHFKAAGFAFEFATLSGAPVVLEMWAFPTKDVAVTALYKELKPLLEAGWRPVRS